MHAAQQRIQGNGRSVPRAFGATAYSVRPRIPCYCAAMETKPPIPRAVLVGIQTPEVDDIAHAASLEELGVW